MPIKKRIIAPDPDPDLFEEAAPPPPPPKPKPVEVKRIPLVYIDPRPKVPFTPATKPPKPGTEVEAMWTWPNGDVYVGRTVYGKVAGEWFRSGTKIKDMHTKAKPLPHNPIKWRPLVA